jgi:hypothetical protein
MAHYFLLLSFSLLSSLCTGDLGLAGDVVGEDIFGNHYSGYEAKQPQQFIQPRQEVDRKDCSSFTASAGVRCVSYHDCDDAGMISKTPDNLIDVRIDVSDDDTDVASLYCPGKFDICCKDPDLVSVLQEVFPVHEGNFHLFHEHNEPESIIMGPTCPPSWSLFNGSCYYFAESPHYMSWAVAGDACKAVDANSSLPSIHSGAEDEFLQTKATSHPFWLGASRNVGAHHLSPSSWSWADGTAMNYTAWASGQPNNYWWGERCVRSIKEDLQGTLNTWDDHKCWYRTATALVCKMQLDMQ